MRKIDVIILLIGAFSAILWAVVSGKDGFKGSDATIVARSITITATIDGQVENKPPEVGAWVNNNDLLARVHNGRIDRSRLIEFESQIAYLESEIGNVKEQLEAIDSLKDEFETRAVSYSQWRLRDLKLGHREASAQLDVARASKRLEQEEVDRNLQLYEKDLISAVEMRIAQTQAEIAGNQVELNAAQHSRSALMLQTMETDGVFFADGDASYWEKIADTLAIRQFDSRNRIALLEFQLTQARAQASAENTRIASSFAEEHRAPFTGMVNARYVTESTRVTSGTTLLQLLDCTHPVVIIPIPDNRTSEFSIGQRVTVYPVDSERTLPGSISYISSGPMIGSDTSIQIQQAVVLDGNRAIVSLDEDPAQGERTASCETSRKAVAVIHTESIFDRVLALI